MGTRASLLESQGGPHRLPSADSEMPPSVVPSAVCRSPLRVPSGRVTCHIPRDVKAAQVGCGVRGRARPGLDTRGRLDRPAREAASSLVAGDRVDRARFIPHNAGS